LPTSLILPRRLAVDYHTCRAFANDSTSLYIIFPALYSYYRAFGIAPVLTGMYGGRTNGQQDVFVVADTGTRSSNRASDPVTSGRQPAARPVSATTTRTDQQAGGRDSMRSANNDFMADGTTRSDPGGESRDARYNASAVCIDEKVLKQIR